MYKRQRTASKRPGPTQPGIILTLMRTCDLETSRPGPPSSALSGRPTARSPAETILEGAGTSLLGKGLPEKAILANSFALERGSTARPAMSPDKDSCDH